MKFRRKARGIALLTVLIFMLLVTIIAGAVLSIMTKQARIAEHQIRRIKAFYAAESAMNKAYQALRFVNTAPLAPAPGPYWTDLLGPGGGVWQWSWDDNPSGQGFEWRIDTTGTPTQRRDITVYYNTTANVVTVNPTPTTTVNLPPNGGLVAFINYSP